MKKIKRILSFAAACILTSILPVAVHAEFYNDEVPNNIKNVADAPLADEFRNQFSYEDITADGFSSTLHYRLYVPSNYDPDKTYPVVLFLHGAGEWGTENEKQLNVGMMNAFFSRGYYSKFECFIIAPQCGNEPKNFKGEWAQTGWMSGSYKIDLSGTTGPTYTENIQLAKLAVDRAVQEYSIDIDRLYVTGISMGGYGTWNIITHYNDYFAAAMPICGAGDPTAANRLVNMPIWCFHGEKDGGLGVPVQGSRDMYNALTAAGSTKINYTEWPGVGHAWNPAYVREEVWAWLFAQAKNTVDASVLAVQLTELNKIDTTTLSEKDSASVTSAIAYLNEVKNSSVATPAMVNAAKDKANKVMHLVPSESEQGSNATKPIVPILLGCAAVVALAVVGIVVAMLVGKAKK